MQASVKMREWDEEFDVVVVGFGFAGGVSAISAHDAGARVLLVEKADYPGGISICSAGGIRITRDADAAFRYLKETNADTAPDGNLRVLAEGMATIADFVKQLASVNGAELAEADAPGNYPLGGYESFGFISVADIPGFDVREGYPHVRGLRGGARMFKVIEDNVRERGIDVRMSTRAVELVQDNARAIVGIVLENNGRRKTVHASGIVLSCGGFEAAEDMKRQYWQEKPVAPAAFLGNTGDGIRMAQGVGADLWHMWHYHGTYGLRHPAIDRYPYGIRLARFPDWTPGLEGSAEMPAFFLSASDTKMPWIVVDQFGRRYMNEYPPYLGDTGHRPMVYFDPVTQSYPRIPSYLIFDRHGFESHEIGFPTYNNAEMKFAWSKDNRAELEMGWIKKGDSVDALAAAIECAPEVLRKTLGEWNAVCRGERQDEFGREGGRAVPLENAPYFAVQVWPIVANTQGGPVRDERQRVLTPFGRPIAGLYSAGELGSIFGHLYISGGNLAECFVGGRIAGREAAAYAGR